MRKFVKSKIQYLLSREGKRRLNLIWNQLKQRKFRTVYYQCLRFLQYKSQTDESLDLLEFVRLLQITEQPFSPKYINSKFTVGVVIPVFNNIDNLPKLISSLANQTLPPNEIIIIDDGSSNPSVKAYLTSIRDTHNLIKVIMREFNGGFPVSANEGLTQLETSIKIILNSDVEISRYFIERMQEPFLSDPTIGSVTAMTNHGSIAAIPEVNAATDNLFASLSLEKANEILGILHTNYSEIKKWPRIPVGVGHALAFRSETLLDVGLFDVEAFSPGYGEEVDWSLRAANRGWIHVLHPGNFVFHAEGKSFGAKRNWLIAQHNEIINERYPSYQYQIDSYIRHDELRNYRIAAALALLTIASDVDLYVNISHGRGGGSALWSYDKIENQPLKVSITSDGILARVELSIFDSRFGWNSEWKHVFQLLLTIKPDFLEIGSIALINQSDQQKFLRELNQFIEELGQKPFKTFVIHDFHSVCPSYNLLDFKGDFCEVPRVEKCSSCFEINMFIPFTLRKEGVTTWRSQYSQIIEKCNLVVFLSQDSQKWFKKAFPDVNVLTKIIQLDEWINFPSNRNEIISGTKSKDFAKKLLFLGNLNYAKGSEIVNSLAKYSELEGNEHLEIHLLGALDVMPHKNVNYHGEYSREELPLKLSLVAPDYIFFASIWPETYCIAAEEAVRLGYRVLAFDIGAIPERIELRNGFVKLPLTLASDTLKLYEKLKTI